MLRMILALVVISVAAISQVHAEMRATAYGHTMAGVEHGEIRNSLGYEFAPGPDDDLMVLDRAFEIAGCSTYINHIPRANLSDSQYGLSKATIRELQLTRLRFIPGSGVTRFYSRTYCNNDNNDGQEFRGFPLFAPYSHNGMGEVDLVSFLEQKYAGQKIELMGLYPVLTDRTLFLVVDFKKDESFRGYEFVKVDFLKDTIQLTDISPSLANLLGSLDMEDIAIVQFGLLNGELAFEYKKGGWTSAATKHLGLLTLDLKSNATIALDAERLWEGRMVDNRFLVSVGSSSDLGGGMYTRAAHTIIDWKTKQVVPGIAETTVPSGCSLMKTFQPTRTEAKSSYAFTTGGASKGIVTVSVDHLSCLVAGSTEPEFVVRAKATRLELDATGNPVVNVIFDQELDRTAIPAQVDDVSAALGHYLFGYQNGADTEFALMLHKTVFSSPTKEDIKEIRLIYDAAKSEFRIR